MYKDRLAYTHVAMGILIVYVSKVITFLLFLMIVLMFCMPQAIPLWDAIYIETSFLFAFREVINVGT